MWLVLYVICHFHVEACLALGSTAGNQGHNAKGLKIDVTFGVPPVSVIMWRVQNLMILKTSGCHSFKGPLLCKL